MKRTLCLIFFLPVFAFAQIEDFSDGNFTANPPWTGDVSEFIVNSQLQLQLNSSGTGLSYLSSALSQPSLDSVEWRCWARLNFSPSGSNYGRIYLVSDNSNLEGPLNGYFIQLGEALGNDAVELFKQSGTVLTSIARGTNGVIASSFEIGIRVTRSANAEWRLHVDYGGGTNYSFEASGNDSEFNASSHFGVVCSYTSSNATSFYFDNFETGPIVVDQSPPALNKITVVSSSLLDLKFSEQVETASSENVLNYSVNNGIGSPLNATRDATDKSLVHLSFATSFNTGIIYTLDALNIKDLNNNIAGTLSAQFALPDTVKPGDIVINEILFNPYSGGFDFVEVFNRSQKTFDLASITIANTDELTGAIDDTEALPAESGLFFPGDYRVITEDPADIRQRYTSAGLSSFIRIADLPSYNDDEGGVVLLDNALNIIDKFIYKDDFHFPLLNDDEGVSLERLSPDRITQDSSNWHSAASSVGFATPGLKNSQFSAGMSDGSEITVAPEIFSPDNDGFEDVLNIHYKFDSPGYVATVRIYDSRGRRVADVVSNDLLGTEEGTWSWNGITNENEKALLGIYIIHVEAFNASGATKEIKKTCVVAGKL